MHSLPHGSPPPDTGGAPSAAATAPVPCPSTPMIRCADCLHCQQYKEFARSGRYILKVRCAKGNWHRGKDSRLAATYDLHTLMARRVQKCPEYESLSDSDEERERFLAELGPSLPIERHIYNPDGSFVDKTEVMRWDATT